MIGHLQGILIEKQPPQLTIDLSGVGYEVLVPMSTFYQLPDTGQSVKLYIHQQIREDAHILYGFVSLAERALFKQCIKINGVGPKIGLALLSTLSIEELLLIIATKDTKRLLAVPGIGQKTAERLVLELQGKSISEVPLTNHTLSAHGKKLQILNDIAGALLALGYSEKESSAMIKNLPDDVDINTGIRLALKQPAVNK
ncbi:MAG: Holliday junction branch migration protein RuvA [Neisseriales bacterium]|nr:MAG: Holliday junction branch migration protein RuvA [Neisseriales bacterium]